MCQVLCINLKYEMTCFGSRIYKVIRRDLIVKLFNADSPFISGSCKVRCLQHYIFFFVRFCHQNKQASCETVVSQMATLSAIQLLYSWFIIWFIILRQLVYYTMTVSWLLLHPDHLHQNQPTNYGNGFKRYAVNTNH